jgi:hypothetical protein
MSLTRADWDALDRPRSWDYPTPKPRRTAKTTRR